MQYLEQAAGLGGWTSDAESRRNRIIRSLIDDNGMSYEEAAAHYDAFS
jgi:hypothetical protein